WAPPPSGRSATRGSPAAEVGAVSRQVRCRRGPLSRGPPGDVQAASGAAEELGHPQPERVGDLVERADGRARLGALDLAEQRDRQAGAAGELLEREVLVLAGL